MTEYELMPRDEVCRVLGNITEGTLANHRTKGTGPHYIKTGGRVQYLAKDVWAYIHAGRRQSTPKVAA